MSLQPVRAAEVLVKQPIRTAALLGTLAACAMAAAPGPGAAVPPVSRSGRAEQSGAAAGDVRVLLSSVDMTVRLIDAYGQCRERPESHERCMAILRETLDHARSMLGR
jgi:hypothetical protein